MRKLRLLVAVVVATAAAVAIGLWLARDEPRRIVHSAPAERLDAEVAVGSLHVDGPSAVRLGEVVIRAHAAPGLRVIRIDRQGLIDCRSSCKIFSARLRLKF